MTFEELVSQIKDLKIEEMRENQEDYLEVVVTEENLNSATTCLKTYFGEPFKPQGEAPSEEANRFSGAYGGVQRGQTLYLHNKDKGPELALLWPWSSGTPITIKIIRDYIK